MKFYNADDLRIILGVSRSKAYQIISELIADLKKIGKLSPKAGSIQKSYFCERFMLTVEECDQELLEYRRKKREV